MDCFLLKQSLRIAANQMIHRRIHIVAIVAFCAVLLPAGALADESSGFTASLADCTEVIAFGPIPLANVEPLVPARFTIVSFGPGTAGLVVRSSQCQKVTFGPEPAGPVLVAQIGVAIVSADGTGDINNYSLLYVTNSRELAESLAEVGWPAQVDRTLAYEFSPNASGSGQLYIAVSPFDGPYFLTGNASAPTGQPAPVVANWWFAAYDGVAKLSTAIPAIAYGPAATVLYSSRTTNVGKVIAGNTDANFVFFNARGVFASGQLKVSLTR